MRLLIDIRIEKRFKLNVSIKLFGEWTAVHFARGYTFLKLWRWEYERVSSEGV